MKCEEKTTKNKSSHYINDKEFYNDMVNWQKLKIRLDNIEILSEAIETNKSRIKEVLEKNSRSIPKVNKLVTEHEILIDQYTIKLNDLTLSSKEKRDYKLMHNRIGVNIMSIIDHYATLHKYRGYSYLEDMKLLAMEHCMSGLQKFDTEKFKSPFWYFTKSVYHAFLQEIAAEKKLFRNKFEYVKRFVANDKMLNYDYNNGEDISDYINELEQQMMDEDSEVYENFKRGDKSIAAELAPCSSSDSSLSINDSAE